MSICEASLFACQHHTLCQPIECLLDAFSQCTWAYLLSRGRRNEVATNGLNLHMKQDLDVLLSGIA